MWTELFLSNRDNILTELDIYIESLQKYQSAIKNNDEEMLITLLDEGKRRKEEVDG
jgi:prephenate dehydrogenase